MSQGSDLELEQTVLDHVTEVSGCDVRSGDLWVRREADGTVSFGPLTATGREAIRRYLDYGEGACR